MCRRVSGPTLPQALRESRIPSATLFERGKVRHAYDLGSTLLMVATDRLSAFDVVLPQGIPGKGVGLTRISNHWFRFTARLERNHLTIECIARGYPGRPKAIPRRAQRCAGSHPAASPPCS